MVQHERHNLIGTCHLAEREPGVRCFKALGLRPAQARESTYLYAAHTSFPVDPCG